MTRPPAALALLLLLLRALGTLVLLVDRRLRLAAPSVQRAEGRPHSLLNRSLVHAGGIVRRARVRRLRRRRGLRHTVCDDLADLIGRQRSRRTRILTRRSRRRRLAPHCAARI